MRITLSGNVRIIRRAKGLPFKFRFVMNRKFLNLLFSVWALALVCYNFKKFMDRRPTSYQLDLQDIDRLRERQFDESQLWKLDEKLRFIQENLQHRVDFVEYMLEESLKYARPKELNKTALFRRLEANLNKINAEIEKVYELNRIKPFRIRSMAESISNKIAGLQTGKCRLDNLVVCALEQKCGYACQFHTLCTCMLIAYYMNRTTVFAKPRVKGMENFSDIFLPVTNSCEFNLEEYEQIRRNSFSPLKINFQLDHGPNPYKMLRQDVKELAKYHSEPVAFVIGQLASSFFKVNPASKVGKIIRECEDRFQLTRPYVGIHIRRGDKWSEAHLYDPSEYMRRVEEFYTRYFIRNPDKINSTKKTVYVASDELSYLTQIKSSYPDYNVYYNNSFYYKVDFNRADERYTQEGFESMVVDLHFLANADYLVCTMSSNVCRIAYELLISRTDDKMPAFFSLDLPYHHISDAEYHRVAVLADDREPKLKKGDLLRKRVVTGLDFDEYKHNGFFYGLNEQSNQYGNFPSYKLKNIYI